MHIRILFLIISCLICSTLAEAEIRDPTRPSSFDELDMNLPLSNWKLQAILTGKDRKLAVINDAIVYEGDRIYGNEIVKINRNSVDVQSPDGLIKLFLLDHSNIRITRILHKGK